MYQLHYRNVNAECRVWHSLCKYMAVAVGAVSVVLLPQVKKHIKVNDSAALNTVH